MSFTMLPNVAIDRMNELSSGAWKLYVFLLRSRNQKTGLCCPSVKITAEAIDVHEKNVFKLRKELAMKNWATFAGDQATNLLGCDGSKNATHDDASKELIADSSKNTTNSSKNATEADNSSKNTTIGSKNATPVVAKTLLDSSKNATPLYEEQYELTRREREPHAHARTTDSEDLRSQLSATALTLAKLCNYHPDLLTQFQFNGLVTTAERLERARGYAPDVLSRFRDYWHEYLNKRVPIQPHYVTEHFGNYLDWKNKQRAYA